MTDYYDDDSTLVTEENTKSSRPLKSVTGLEIVRAIKIQWRALILALIFLITYAIYSVCILHYEKNYSCDNSDTLTREFFYYYYRLTLRLNLVKYCQKIFS